MIFSFSYISLQKNRHLLTLPFSCLPFFLLNEMDVLQPKVAVRTSNSISLHNLTP